MKPERLVNPFLIYWDVNLSTSDDKMILRICDELIEAKIFVLNLRDFSSPISRGTINILRRLYSGGIKINLTANKTVLENSVNVIKETGVSKLYVEFDSFVQFQSSVDDIVRLIKDGYSVGVSFNLSEKNYREIPAVISLCEGGKIKELKFPIQRATDDKIFYFDSEKANWLSDELKRIYVKDLNLTIHDPFMWSLFHSSENPNEAGCNGAKTMMYISEHFDIMPCSLLPVYLGNLHSTTLQKIFSSEKRKQIINKLLIPPYNCRDCRVLDKCKGGCRGRTYVISKSFNKRDPACLLDL
jgi:GeoRSP system SPASM domain protein